MTRFADDSLVRIAPLRENPRPASDPESFGATRPPSLAVLVAADKLTSLDGATDAIGLGDFLTRNVLSEIRRVPGVGKAQLFASERSMRV